MIIDTHCHLTYPDFNRDRDAVLFRAKQVGVERYVTVATGPDEWRRTLDLADSHTEIRVALGVHPNEAAVYSAAVNADLLALARSNPQVVAIGETGLDFFRDNAPREKQYEAFRGQLAIAKELSKPFVLHCRAAETEMLDVLTEHAGGGSLNGVWHCFTANAEHGRRAAALNLYFGIGGIITYPKSAELREAVATLPDDRILLETDCPFLPPQGWRGQRNEPSYLTKVVEVLAETRKTTPEAIRSTTTENARRLFDLGIQA